MQESFEETSIVQHLLIPYDHMRELSNLYTEVEVLLRDEVDAGVRLAVRLPSDKLPAFQRRYAAFVTAAAAHVL
jgi:hypothetical protein